MLNPASCEVNGKVYVAVESNGSCKGCVASDIMGFCGFLAPCSRLIRPDKESVIWKEVDEKPEPKKNTYLISFVGANLDRVAVKYESEAPPTWEQIVAIMQEKEKCFDYKDLVPIAVSLLSNSEV